MSGLLSTSSECRCAIPLAMPSAIVYCATHGSGCNGSRRTKSCRLVSETFSISSTASVALPAPSLLKPRPTKPTTLGPCPNMGGHVSGRAG